MDSISAHKDAEDLPGTPKTKIIHTASQIMLKKLTDKSKTHKDFDSHEEWLDYVYLNFPSSHPTIICRILQFNMDCKLFGYILGFPTMLRVSSVAAAAQLQGDFRTHSPSNVVITDLQSIISSLDHNSGIQICIDKGILNNNVILQLSRNTTISFPAGTLVKELTGITSLLYPSSSSETASPVDTTIQKYTVPHRRAVPFDSQSDLKARIKALEIDQSSTVASLQLLRQSSTIGIGRALAESKSANTNIEEQKRRTSPTIEETFRLRLAAPQRSSSDRLRVQSLNDLLSWIKEDIGVTGQATETALSSILKCVLNGFMGFERADDDRVDWTELDAYSKLVRWIGIAKEKLNTMNEKWAAAKGKNVDDELGGYNAIAAVIWNDIQKHQAIAHDDESPLNLRRSILEQLTYDSRTAFAALWMLIAGNDMIPKLDEDFGKWERPEINLEFDHRGMFKKMVGGVFLYEGGESKSAPSDIKRARRQLERRFHLIDAVMNIGFNLRCVYSANIYVPYIPSTITEREAEKPITFLRRTTSDISHTKESQAGKSKSAKRPAATIELSPESTKYFCRIEAF